VTVTVVPPASPPVVSAADASALESAGSIPELVSLAPTSTGTVTVQYATADGSAKAGTDYTAVSGTLTFAAGQTSKTVLVPISNNSQPGPSTSFTFKLSNPSNALIGNSTATLTIRDDDTVSPKPPIVQNSGPPSPQQQKPIPVPTPQPKTNAKHVVLVQVLTGQSTVDPKGYAHFKLSCPAPAVKTCQGTVMLQVRIQPKKPKGAKKDPPLQTVTIGSGTFKIHVITSALVKVKMTKQGLSLLEAYRRIKVKATVSAKDAQNVKGITAWFVTVQAPARAITINTK
jgi:Calx-beta domain